MIRIPPYPERVKREYLYFAAGALPFWRKEILPKDETGNVIPWEKIVGTVGGKPTYSEPGVSALEGKNEKKSLADIRTLCGAGSEVENPELVRLFLKKYAEKLYAYLYEQDRLQEEKLKALLLQPMGAIPELDCPVKELLTAEDAAREKECRDALLFIFSYGRFSGRKNFDRLIEHMGVDVCPYCNRALIRPTRNQRTGQMDHFRDKADHPQFAVSLLNLVPSCTVCNHKKAGQAKLIFYPHGEELLPEDKFQTEPVSGFQYLLGEAGCSGEFKLTLKQTEKSGMPQQERDAYKEKVENAFGTVFDLEELYQQQKEYVLMMFRQNTVWGEPYLESLKEGMPGMFTEEEWDGIRYLRSIDPENYIHTPLGRLTHDISEEIGRLQRAAEKKEQG